MPSPPPTVKASRLEIPLRFRTALGTHQFPLSCVPPQIMNGSRLSTFISQYWEMNVDNRDPFMICGGTQDNGNWCVPSAVRNRNGISNRDAFTVGGGDGMYFQIDPRDTNYAFIETNSVTTTSSIQRLNLTSLAKQSYKPAVGRPISCYDADTVWARGGRGLHRGVGDDPSYRWGWDAPIVFSGVTPGVVYVGTNALLKSTDRGGSWKAISG